MKKVFIIFAAISMLTTILIPCSAIQMDNYMFNGGVYNETIYADAINISYCNVDGYFFAGDTLSLGAINENQFNQPALCSYPVPSMLGRNVFGDFVPFSLNGVEVGLSYSANVPADQTEVSYSLIPNVVTTYNDVMQVEFEIPNAHSLYFVGSFGHHLFDYAEDFCIDFTSGSVRVWQSGTYYILNHIEDGESPHLITIPVNRSWGTTGNQVSFAPDWREFELPNASFDWYFVGSILVQPSATNTNPDILFKPRVSYRMIPEYEYSVARSYYDVYDVTYTGEYHNFAEKFFTHYIQYYTKEVYGTYNAEIFGNGIYTFDVSEYDEIQINVNVPGGVSPTPGNVLTIEENGFFDVTQYSYVDVDVPQEIIEQELPSNMFSWLLEVASGFLKFEIAPNFTIGGIMILCVGFALIMWVLKVFLGG